MRSVNIAKLEIGKALAYVQNTFNQNHAKWNFQNYLFPHHFMRTDTATCTQPNSKNENRPASTVLRNKSYIVSEHEILANPANFACTSSIIKLTKEQNKKLEWLLFN